VRATQRLITRGFEAYLVGGCVRDLLLGRAAKDYDIATEARPQQVKRTFPRNCRIIGRRFKLAHLHFHDNTKILEVSTFRRTPQMDNAEDDLLITRDNEFGSAEEDALRRDFTVNALFLDPTRDRILDYTGGLQDIEARVIRTIGDPRVRFREDPVRILRAAKFAARLGFRIESDTLAAMAEVAPDLVRSAPPRLLEEILRLLRSGHALDSFQLLRDVGAMRSLLPVVADYLAAAPQQDRVGFWRLLEALDHAIADGRVPPNPVLLGSLFYRAVAARLAETPGAAPATIAEEQLGPLGQTLRLPRRDAGCLKRICGVQHRFLQTDEQKRFRVQGFLHGPYFREALFLFELRCLAEGLDLAAARHWRSLADREGIRSEFERGPMHPGERSRGFQPREVEGAPDASAQREEVPAEDRDRPYEVQTAGSGDDRSAEPAPFTPARDAAPGLPFRVTEEDRTGRRRRRRRRRGRHRHEDQGGFAPRSAELPEGAGRPFPGAGEHAAGDEPGPDEWNAAATDRAAGDARRAPWESPPPGSDMAPDTGLLEPAAPDQARDARLAEPGLAGDEGDRGRRRRRRRRRGHRGAEGARGPAPLDESQPPALPPPASAPGSFADRGAPAEERDRDERRAAELASEAALAAFRREADRGRPEPQGQGGERRRRRRGRDRHRDDSFRQRPLPRDVDVVPRHRDRRGKVEVIEPPPLDLSAFDSELGKKHVPTFGSIVEGSGRQKRRPRLPDDQLDDYRPPPPPGGGPGPGAPPPPPPPNPEPDTYGDW
jgi:poly(A) polymerase